MISVIIPSHNGLQYLHDCIPSILDQPYKNLEIIVVDNASADGSREYLANSYSQVKVLENKENLGFGKAVNEGIENAKGQFLLILNNDTRLDQRAIESLIDGYSVIASDTDGLAGLAPKIVASDFLRFIDGVGVGVGMHGVAYNIGAGQFDLGQFDAPVRVFGLCFA